MGNRMRQPMIAALGGLGVLLAGASNSVQARKPASLHDIPWYMAHEAARTATLNLCRNDHAFARMPDCANAETAETRLWAERAEKQSRSSTSRLPDDYPTSPQFWAENGLARVGALGSCNHPPTIYPPEVCAAVRAGDTLAAAKRPRQ